MTGRALRRLLSLVALVALPLAAPSAAGAQDAAQLARRVQLIEDRIALKALVDTFSILADRKDVTRQLQLFTADATVENRSAGAPSSVLRGRTEIGNAFAAFLANFSTVYHMNGQHAVTVEGDRATGTAYCLVILIGTQDGRTVRQTMGVRYDDVYVRQGGAWRIAQRTSHFEWRDSAVADSAR